MQTQVFELSCIFLSQTLKKSAKKYNTVTLLTKETLNVSFLMRVFFWFCCFWRQVLATSPGWLRMCDPLPLLPECCDFRSAHVA